MKQAMGNKIFVACILSAMLLLPGCSPKKSPDSAVVATVNDKPIYLADLKRELSNMVKQSPSLEINKDTVDDVLDTMIKRQLIIEEAMARKMAEEARFRDSIKAFWEQTLIRNFVDYKSQEFDRYVFVTDKEVEGYYNELKEKATSIPPFEEVRERIRELLRQEKKAGALEDWLEAKKKNAKIHINKKELKDF